MIAFRIEVCNDAAWMMYVLLTPLLFMISGQLGRSLVTTQLNTAANVVIIPLRLAMGYMTKSW